MDFTIKSEDVTKICNEVSLNKALQEGLHGRSYTRLYKDSEYIVSPPVVHNLEASNPLLKSGRVDPGDYLLCSLDNCMLVGPYAMIYLEDETLVGESGCSYHNDHIQNNLRIRLEYDKNNIAAQRAENPIYRASNHHTANFGHTLAQSIGMMRALDKYKMPDECVILGHNFFQSFVDDLYALAGYWNVMNYNGNLIYCNQLLFSCMRDISQENMDWVRGKFRKAIQHIHGFNQPPKKLFLSRKNVRRRIVNEEELLPVLEKHGFAIIVPENLSILQQCVLFSNADVIVGAYGAALCNCVFMEPGGKMLELCGEEWAQDSWFRTYAAACRMQYAKIVGISCGPGDNSSFTQQKDFSVDVDILDELLGRFLEI